MCLLCTGSRDYKNIPTYPLLYADTGLPEHPQWQSNVFTVELFALLIFFKLTLLVVMISPHSQIAFNTQKIFSCTISNCLRNYSNNLMQKLQRVYQRSHNGMPASLLLMHLPY